MAVSIDHRAAYERRVWRLAYLLTGNAAGAALLVDRVLDTQPDLEGLEPARLDRVVIQQARELPRLKVAPVPGPEPTPDPQARGMMEAILKLPEQPREAWVLTRVDELDELHVSRAMDCSRTATKHHLEAAEAQMEKGLGAELGGGLAALRRFADGLDPAPIITAHREQRRKLRFRRTAITAGAILVVLLIAALAILQGWFV